MLELLQKDTKKDKCGNKYSLYKCSCGVVKEIRHFHVTTGKTKSCGCLQRQHAGTFRKSHGMSGTPEYHVWESMINRCNSKSPKTQKYYGNIYVCDEWKSFEKFYSDMGPRPSEKHSIDRINGSIGYCKSNCRWATLDVQLFNRSNTVVYNGETSAEAARRLGITSSCMCKRIKYYKWSLEKAFNTPSKVCKKTQ